MTTQTKRPSVLDTCRAFADGNLDAPLAQNYQQQTPLVDDAGRVWVRLHSGADPLGPANPLPVAGFGASVVTIASSGPSLGVVEYVGATQLVALAAVNLSALVYYVQVFDAAALPAPAAVPAITMPLPKTGSVSWTIPHTLAVGLTWALSTTAAVYTAAISPDAWVNAYRSA